MPLNEGLSLAAEDGTTMVELLVGLAMGMVVLAGLSMLLIATMHGNARVDARVEATDNARLTMTRIMEELHSACVSPTLAPVQEGSTGEKLILIHGAYGQEATADELPVKSTITYSSSGGTLSQVDQPATSVSGGSWVWGPEESARILVSNVGPVEAGKPLFTYYKYENGHLSNSLLASSTEPLNKENAAATILVNVEFTAEPKAEPVADAGVDAAIRNSATLRLTPPSYTETAKAYPCQ